jgi:hypothetical protein
VLICPTAEAECFFCEGWTRQITLESLANFSPPSLRGDAKASSPESIKPLVLVDQWIPGLRLAAHPGMTGEVVASRRRITLCALAKTQS